MAYDSWGKRHTLNGAPVNGTPTPDNLDGVTDNKGFTGHEMMDQPDLMHMNGRIFDPLVARMMSAAPYIQDPLSSQRKADNSQADGKALRSRFSLCEISGERISNSWF